MSSSKHDWTEAGHHHTGQHYDPNMSDAFFSDLGLPTPEHNLGIGSGSHAEQTGGVMIAYEKLCLAHRPDWVVVVGDVNSTIACCLAANEARIARRSSRGGLAQPRPHHAGGNQPAGHRRDRRAAVDAVGGRRREPAGRRRPTRAHRARRQHHARATSWCGRRSRRAMRRCGSASRVRNTAS